MKILVVHTKYKEKGGEDSVVDNEIRLLKESGHTVMPLYFDNQKHNHTNLFCLPFNLFSYLKTIRVIKRFQPHVMHLHNLHFAASPSVIIAGIHKKVPVVKTLHNYRLLCPSGTLFFNNKLYYNSLQSSFPWDAVRKKIYRNSVMLTFWLAFTVWLHKQLGTFRKIDKYIVLNEKSRSLFLASGLQLKKEQVILKPNFITAEQQPLPVERGDHFLYVGRLSPEKGIDVLLQAFAVNGFALTIIGDGPMREQVRDCQKQNPRITWLGHQPKETIEAEMKRCTALLTPSVCLEGMPLTIVEAFAAGTPVIASRLGAMQTLVIHNLNGLLFTPDKRDSLNRQLRKWKQFSMVKKNDFSKQAYHSYEEKYTPEKNLSMLLSVYTSILNKKKPQENKRIQDVLLTTMQNKGLPEVLT